MRITNPSYTPHSHLQQKKDLADVTAGVKMGHVRKSKLPASELEVCARLRHAREEILGMTQAGCARQINLDRTTLANYETGRTPLRYEIALRFCRQFIICEEWLATGRFDACHQAAGQHGIAPVAGWDYFDSQIFMRQCVDLLSDHTAINIKPGTLYSEAFAGVLAPRYSELVSVYFHLPRIGFTGGDNKELALNFLNAVNTRHSLLLKSPAAALGIGPGVLWAAYARCLLECSYLIYRKVKGDQLPEKLIGELAWLREIATNPNASIPAVYYIGDSVRLIDPRVTAQNIYEKDLMNTSSQVSFDDVKPQLPSLLDRLKKAAAAPGQKTALAKVLGAPLESVSRWLSGKQEPGGEITLKLLKWVEEQERQK